MPKFGLLVSPQLNNCRSLADIPQKTILVISERIGLQSCRDKSTHAYVRLQQTACWTFISWNHSPSVSAEYCAPSSSTGLRTALLAFLSTQGAMATLKPAVQYGQWEEIPFSKNFHLPALVPPSCIPIDTNKQSIK